MSSMLVTATITTLTRISVDRQNLVNSHKQREQANRREATPARGAPVALSHFLHSLTAATG